MQNQIFKREYYLNKIRGFYESGAKRAKPPKRAGLFLKSRRARRFRADTAAHRRAHETAAATQN